MCNLWWHSSGRLAALSRLARAYAVACSVICTAVLLVACSPELGAVLGATVAGPSLRVGIGLDQPGLAVRGTDGSVHGFDADVVRYVAAELGVEASRVIFVDARPGDREAMLERSEVDLVLGPYSPGTPRVDFVGPYLVAGQSLLVRRNNSDIDGPASLDHGDWRLCEVPGSAAADRLRDRYARAVSLVELGGFASCVLALLAGEVDAVTTDDVILAGYAAQRPDQLQVVGEPFTEQPYGIGLREGDQRRAKVDTAVRNMVDDGSWQRSAQKHLGPSGYRAPKPSVKG